MSLYLVLITTLGSIRGIHAREFVEGETVDLDDDDLAAVGCRDGWLQPLDDLNAAPPADVLADYVVLLPDEMPVPASGWVADRPKAGEIVSLGVDDAAPLLESGVIEPLPPDDDSKRADPADDYAPITPGAKTKPKASKKLKAGGNDDGDN